MPRNIVVALLDERQDYSRLRAEDARAARQRCGGPAVAAEGRLVALSRSFPPEEELTPS